MDPFSRKIPDCECATWAWAPEMGEYPENGHHPNCRVGNPHKPGCNCIRCYADQLIDQLDEPVIKLSVVDIDDE